MDSNNQSLEETNSRLKNPDGRIESISELFKLKNKTIYLVLSPFGVEKQMGSCFLQKWKVGDIGYTISSSKDFILIPDANCLNMNDETIKNVCCHADIINNAISLVDFNIIPNRYNNHAAFKTKKSANKYMNKRKAMYPLNQSFDEVIKLYNCWTTLKR